MNSKCFSEMNATIFILPNGRRKCQLSTVYVVTDETDRSAVTCRCITNLKNFFRIGTTEDRKTLIGMPRP